MIKKLKIRELNSKEYSVLEDFLYEAIFQTDENNLLPRSIIEQPSIKVYIDNFGKKKDDYCLVAEIENRIVGAVWIRILADEIRGYGNVDKETPEFAISILKEYRQKGIGTLLMNEMIKYLKHNGYKNTSLSVDKKNYAAKMYQKLGFEIIENRETDYLMLLKLDK